MTLAWAEGAPPEPGEYVALRAACGLGPRTMAAARAGLPRTLHAVTLRDDGRLVGMGRLVGDGGCFAQVVDIAVAEAYRRRGHGAAIVDRLVLWARANLPETCYLSLIADPGAEALYARAGFRSETGMGLRL